MQILSVCLACQIINCQNANYSGIWAKAVQNLSCLLFIGSWSVMFGINSRQFENAKLMVKYIVSLASLLLPAVSDSSK